VSVPPPRGPFPRTAPLRCAFLLGDVRGFAAHLCSGRERAAAAQPLPSHRSASLRFPARGCARLRRAPVKRTWACRRRAASSFAPLRFAALSCSGTCAASPRTC